VIEISSDLELLGIPGAYEAFKMLRPRAYRSDLWRWMILWKYGGIYIDLKIGFFDDL
jgi:mannosyltransferase OCH1-like enzyme